MVACTLSRACRALALACATLCNLPLYASAHPISTEVGDPDGFGIDAQVDQTFSFLSIGIGDGNGTDLWVFGDQNFMMNNELPGGNLIGASLDIVTGGQGFVGPTQVLINGVDVGALTDGGSLANGGENFVRKDHLDLTPFLSSFHGHDLLSFSLGSQDDGWAIDYMVLTIVSDAPEPATTALFGLGLAALGWVGAGRRRRK